MFGYLRPYKPEMKIKDFSAYKSFYCGMCRTLGKRYGFIARLILSYDAVLMSVLCASIQNNDICCDTCRCPANVLKKCNAVKENDVTDFWTDVSVILYYFKVLDNINDSSFKKKIASYFILPFAKHLSKKAKKNNKFAYSAADDYIVAQNKVEIENCDSVDRAAHPTAELISKLLSTFSKSDSERRIMERVGYFTGRFIYICDATEDYTSDIKENNYNPFIFSKLNNGETLKQFENRLLNSCIYEIDTALDLLSISRYKDIVDNAFYLGLPKMKEAVISDLSKKEKRKKFSAMYKL